MVPPPNPRQHHSMAYFLIMWCCKLISLAKPIPLPDNLKAELSSSWKVTFLRILHKGFQVLYGRHNQPKHSLRFHHNFYTRTFQQTSCNMQQKAPLCERKGFFKCPKGAVHDWHHFLGEGGGVAKKSQREKKWPITFLREWKYVKNWPKLTLISGVVVPEIFSAVRSQTYAITF